MLGEERRARKGYQAHNLVKRHDRSIQVFSMRAVAAQ